MLRIIATVALLLLPEAARAMQVELRIDGLACPFCAYGIEKKLNRTEGVEGLEIDIDAGVVTVTMAEGATLTEEQARLIVEDAGFSLRGFVELRGR